MFFVPLHTIAVGLLLRDRLKIKVYGSCHGYVVIRRVEVY